MQDTTLWRSNAKKRDSTLLTIISDRLINSGAPWNVPAGHRGRNLGELTEHFRQQHIEEEERKIKKLAAAKESS